MLLPCLLARASHADDCPTTLQPSEICLYLKWPLQFQSVGYELARAKGFYDDVDLRVHIVEPALVSLGQDPIPNTVAAAPGRYGIGSSGLLIARFQHSQPIVALAVLFQESPLVLLVKKASPIRVLSDLHGRIVMLEPGSEELQALLRKQHVDLADFSRPEGLFDLQRFISDEVDATSAYTTDELKILQDKGIDVRIFRPSAAGIHFYGDVLFTSEAELRQNPGRAYQFLHASLRGWEWTFDHVDEAIDLIDTVQRRRLDAGISTLAKSRDQLQLEADQMRDLVGPLNQLGHMNAAR